jgi:hypothetical protein
MAAIGTLGTVLAITGAVVGAGASVFSAYQTVQQGQAQQQELNREADVDTLAGKNAFAASQREAEQRQLEGKLIMSKAQAYAAASGGGAGADDPTIAKILTDTGDQAQYGADSVMYQGASQQSDYLASASAKRQTGQNVYFGSILRGVGTLASAAGGLASSASGMIPVGASNSSSNRWGWSSI